LLGVLAISLAAALSGLAWRRTPALVAWWIILLQLLDASKQSEAQSG
jgi:hypothetical protein